MATYNIYEITMLTCEEARLDEILIRSIIAKDKKEAIVKFITIFNDIYCWAKYILNELRSLEDFDDDSEIIETIYNEFINDKTDEIRIELTNKYLDEISDLLLKYYKKGYNQAFYIMEYKLAIVDNSITSFELQDEDANSTYQHIH